MEDRFQEFEYVRQGMEGQVTRYVLRDTLPKSELQVVIVGVSVEKARPVAHEAMRRLLR